MRDIKLEVITTGAAPVRGKYITGGSRRSRGGGGGQGGAEEGSRSGRTWDNGGKGERHGDTLERLER